MYDNMAIAVLKYSVLVHTNNPKLFQLIKVDLEFNFWKIASRMIKIVIPNGIQNFGDFYKIFAWVKQPYIFSYSWNGPVPDGICLKLHL